VSAIVLLNAMIPKSGERAGEWWGNVDAAGAMREAALFAGYTPEFDVNVHFLHDVPTELAKAGESEQRNEDDRAFADVCTFEWPDVPIHVAAGQDDRFFPLAFQQRVARDRLDLDVDVLPGGHLIALSQPEALADYLVEISPNR